MQNVTDGEILQTDTENVKNINYKPGAMERANALADRTKQRDEIYGKRCYLVSIINSSQMDWVKKCTGLNQAAPSGT